MFEQQDSLLANPSESSPDYITRFSRQLLVRGWSGQAQRKLGTLAVALPSNFEFAGRYLAGAGVRALYIYPHLYPHLGQQTNCEQGEGSKSEVCLKSWDKGNWWNRGLPESCSIYNLLSNPLPSPADLGLLRAALCEKESDLPPLLTSQSLELIITVGDTVIPRWLKSSASQEETFFSAACNHHSGSSDPALQAPLQPITLPSSLCTQPMRELTAVGFLLSTFFSK